MSKLLAESLEEFRGQKEDLNEAIQPGKTFRQNFLKAGHSFVKGGRPELVKTMVAWAKKLQELGWPKEAAIKKAVGDQKFKSFIAAVNLMNKQIPSFGATPGGNVQSGKGGDVGKDDATRLQVVADAAGLSAEELKALITK